MRQFVIENPSDQHGKARNHHGEAPEKQWHQHLCSAAAEVSPTRRHGVCRADNFGRKHHGGVVLRDDERRTDCSDGKAEEQEHLVIVRQPNQHDRKRPEYQQPGVGKAGTHAVAEPANAKPRNDGDGYARDDGVADLCLGEMQFVADHSHERSNAEPSKEAQEKREPTHVESPHWRRLEIEQADSWGSAIEPDLPGRGHLYAAAATTSIASRTMPLR